MTHLYFTGSREDRSVTVAAVRRGGRDGLMAERI
jgi:hypothetical protein